LLALTFEDFECEVRTVLDGMLGPAGADAYTRVAIDQAWRAVNDLKGLSG